ncbi:phosphoglycerate kinase [Blattabacterium punctulatus]|uniref:phosphoglycerate kinase n=1 Tax=Blattabacterium punctulatus TaxID=164514 RepID=UPI000D7C1F5D|nr:phosphoglycerate kinase [Blattabacterium punctulatus]AWU42631.1 phosphoglycerate kinase [Blattabacterium punctulatus]AWU43175.1 phosphoglycerate kinase [Blattabacterium punctulatus]AWU45913.1 phosphoglycerate kinase [Blattabacterium punctulatus]
MKEDIKTVNDFNFKNKTAIVRVDFNVPINNKSKKILDDTRIKYSIPTIKKIINEYGKVVLISHFGRPKGKRSKTYSLKFIVSNLSKKLKIPIKFSEYCIGETVEKRVNELKNGEILLLENIRFYKEEEEGDENFAFQLSKLGDIYVNDAFSVSHRLHASITITPKFFGKNKCIGFLMKKEIHSLKKIFGKGKKPITILLGGAKIYSKISIIENLINLVDHILIGGGMAYPFIKIQGGKVGDSIVDKYKYNELEKILKNIFDKYKKQDKTNISFPKDVVIADSFKNNANTKISSIYSIPNGWKGLDLGPKSIKYFCKIIKNSQTILWNGPLGVFEFSNFSLGTKSIARAIVNATKNGAFSLIGGGDSIASLKMEQCEKKISYLSTGGGAMLESLKNKILPGIKSIIS